MKTLLVYPEFPDAYWSFRHALSFEGKRSAFPPLGLLTISAMPPDAWERRLVDMNIQLLKPSDIQWADVVFCSAMLVQKDSLRRVVGLCKAEGKRVVIGGPYVTTSAEHLPEADHIFLGEAETTLPEFVRYLERGEPKRIYQAAERPALSATPISHFQLADLKQYSAMSVQGYKSIMRAIYSPGEYYRRALSCLERVVAGAPVARRNRVTIDVMALFRIVLALGVRDRARGEFWRYLRRALTRHREKFAEAVRLAAVGYHFRKLTED
jgi:radical SAM superfamily enzyme YgiQ (UPF0313 family)